MEITIFDIEPKLLVLVKKKYAFLLLVILVSLPVLITAQTPQLIFHSLADENGQVQSTSQCIIQDKLGFIWFGTQDGLCRYDGYNFKIYKNKPGNPNSLSNNYIWSIHQDKEGILWIGTFGGGLNRFDPITESFTTYRNNPNDPESVSSDRIFKIVEYDGVLWMGTNDGVYCFDKSTGKSKGFMQSRKNGDRATGNYTGSIVSISTGHVWAYTDSGFVDINAKTLESEFLGKTPFSDGENWGTIYDMLEYNGEVYFATKTGLYSVSPETRVSRHILQSAFDGRSPDFLKLLLPQGKRFCIGTNMGLIFFDTETGKVDRHVHETTDPGSISHNTITALCRSRDGITWIGTRTGVNMLYREKPNFGLMRSKQGKEKSMHRSLYAMLEDSNGRLWIGSPEGLKVLDRKTGETTIYWKGEGKNSLRSDYILSLREDKAGNVWIGTRQGGVHRVSSENKGKLNNLIFERLQSKELDISATSIHYILEDKQGIIWLGTGGGGLLKYSPATNEVKQYYKGEMGKKPSHPFIYNILEDSFGNMWLGTPTGGLNIFDRESERFIYLKNSSDNLNSLSNNIVLCTYEDNKQNLWVATAGGLNKLALPLQPNMFEKLQNADIEKDSLFVRYTADHGFPNEVIYGVLEDNNSRLWASTNKGIACFDPISGRVTKTYERGDGLQHNEFNQNGFLKTKNGELFFSGLEGLNFFHPDSLKDNNYKPPVVFTRFLLFNEPISLHDKGKHGFNLDKSIEETKELHLSYDHDVLTFEFAALNFVNPGKNQYQYMLEGFDKEWVNAGIKRSATYTNLDAGEYSFRVKACNNEGLWNEEGAAIAIFIPPPPWLSWYAYLIYLLVFVGIMYSYIRYRVQKATLELEVRAQIEKAKTEERESFRKKSSQDFHDEAGNKITKINMFTELARTEARGKKEMLGFLDKIEQNSKELSAGMRDFIWAMDPGKDTLFDTMIRLKDFGDSMFTDAGIYFAVQGLTEEYQKVKLPMDTRRAIVQIFKEAMNNCAKHAKADEMTLSISLKNGELKIELKDNGKGFDMNEESSQKGYGRSIMAERAEKAGASFSLRSKKGAGTIVAFVCNIPHMGN